MQEMVFLLKNGVPLTEQRKMTATRRWAMCVAIGEAEGGEYDWQRQRWMPRK